MLREDRFEAHHEPQPPLDGWQIRDTVTGKVTHAYDHSEGDEAISREVVALMNKLSHEEQEALVRGTSASPTPLTPAATPPPPDDPPPGSHGHRGWP
jgi:hypothetical protein